MIVCLDDDEVYAGTSSSEWWLMVKQTEKFSPLAIWDIKPGHRDCEICFEPFGPSDHGESMEEPIQLLSCGHIFGHFCLFKWLAGFMPRGKWWDWPDSDAYWPQVPEDLFRIHDKSEFDEAVMHTDVNDVSIAYQEDGKLRHDWRDYLNWHSDDHDDLMPRSDPSLSSEVHNATCPKCRGRFSILRSGVMGVQIEARLQFWDLMYEKIGIRRSAKEEKSRNDLMRYVQMVQAPRTAIKMQLIRSFTLQAQVSAMRFALRRGNRDLDPLQTYLRDAIFNVGCYGLHEPGVYSAISYENRRVPMWCFKVDRIERGLSPKVLAVKHRLSTFDRISFTIQQVQEEYSNDFYRQLKQQVSGPWRRTLFADAGGDRECFRWKDSPIHYPDTEGSDSEL